MYALCTYKSYILYCVCGFISHLTCHNLTFLFLLSFLFPHIANTYPPWKEKVHLPSINFLKRGSTRCRFREGHFPASNLNQLMVSWWFGGPVFWNAAIPLWKGLVPWGYPDSNPKPLGPQTTDLPWKINMEPTNHPFRKENDLPNLHDYVPC